MVDGLGVISLAEAAEAYGDKAAFVITIWGALSADRMAERELQLKRAGCRTVTTWGPLLEIPPFWIAALCRRFGASRA